MMEKKKALKWLCIFIAAGLFFVALITFVFDPFYQYHTPFFGMEQVLNDRDNQVIGTIRSNDYDSVLLGSSVAENFDTDFLNEAYDCETIKVIRASSSISDLLYYMEKVHQEKEIERVFWCMDIFAFTSSTKVTLYGEDIPRYLHTETILDDATYLFNKDILFKTIPQNIVFAYLGTNTDGNAYNWAEGKDFSASGAMRAYNKPDVVLENRNDEEILTLIDENIELMKCEIENHPDTEYIIMFPPYSLLWWDSGYVNGISQQYFAVLEKVLPVLVAYDNVKVYYFQDEQDIVCDLSNYMDMLHYSPEVNQYMLDCVVADINRVSKDDWQNTIEDMKKTYEYIIDEGIYQYYEKRVP